MAVSAGVTWTMGVRMTVSVARMPSPRMTVGMAGVPVARVPACHSAQAHQQQSGPAECQTEAVEIHHIDSTAPTRLL
jgi:hypothetical protein